MGTSYNSSPLFVHFMHLNLPYFIISTIVKAISQSSYLLWELVEVIFWKGCYSFQPILGLYIIQLIISLLIYFHPIQMTLTSQVPLQLYHLHMNISRPNSMLQVFYPTLKMHSMVTFQPITKLQHPNSIYHPIRKN